MSKRNYLRIEAGIWYGIALLAAAIWFDTRPVISSRNLDAFMAYALIVVFGAVAAGYFSKLYMHADRWINFSSIVSVPIVVLLLATYLASLCFVPIDFLQSMRETGRREPVLDFVVSVVFAPIIFIILSWQVLLVGLAIATCIMRIRSKEYQSADAL